MLRKTIPATGKKTLPKCLDFCLVYDANFTNNLINKLIENYRYLYAFFRILCGRNHRKRTLL